MTALADLRELLRVTEQHQVRRRPRRRDRVDETELARLFDHQQVEAAGVDARVVGEIPRGAADYAAVMGRTGDEAAVRVLVDYLPRNAGSGILLGDPRRIHVGFDQLTKQVFDDRMRLGDDSDPPAVVVDQPGNDLGGRGRLAGAGWPVHGQVGRVEVE